MVMTHKLFILFVLTISMAMSCDTHCPEYAPPYCLDWQRLVVEDDSDGCGVPVCRPMPGCPDYELPMCAEGVGLATKTDANGCGMPVCASEEES